MKMSTEMKKAKRRLLPKPRPLLPMPRRMKNDFES